MNNVLTDALFLTTTGFLIGCDVGSGEEGLTIILEVMIAAALLALLLGDLGLVHGL